MNTSENVGSVTYHVRYCLGERHVDRILNVPLKTVETKAPYWASNWGLQKAKEENTSERILVTYHVA